MLLAKLAVIVGPNPAARAAIDGTTPALSALCGPA